MSALNQAVRAFFRWKPQDSSTIFLSAPPSNPSKATVVNPRSAPIRRPAPDSASFRWPKSRSTRRPVEQNFPIAPKRPARIPHRWRALSSHETLSLKLITRMGAAQTFGCLSQIVNPVRCGCSASAITCMYIVAPCSRAALNMFYNSSHRIS